MYYIINKSGHFLSLSNSVLVLFIACMNIKSYFGVFSGSMTATQWFVLTTEYNICFQNIRYETSLVSFSDRYESYVVKVTFNIVFDILTNRLFEMS